jgi:hypothetical protein
MTLGYFGLQNFQKRDCESRNESRKGKLTQSRFSPYGKGNYAESSKNLKFSAFS